MKKLLAFLLLLSMPADATVMGYSYRYSTAAPSSALLEGFEATPYTGLYTTWSNSGSSADATRTSSHVTQGSFTWRGQGAAGQFIQYGTDLVDITPYIAAPTQIKVDVFTATINASDIVALLASDSLGGTDIITSSSGQTGAFTLTLPFSTVTDFTTLQVFVGGISDSFGTLNGTMDVYFDNLRAE